MSATAPPLVSPTADSDPGSPMLPRLPKMPKMRARTTRRSFFKRTPQQQQTFPQNSHRYILIPLAFTLCFHLIPFSKLFNFPPPHDSTLILPYRVHMSNSTRSRTIKDNRIRYSGTFQRPNYSRFFDLTPSQVPSGNIPILNWNYLSVIDESTREQIFTLGKKMEHIGVYKPLCIDSHTETIIPFSDNTTICSGFNHTSVWYVRYCDYMKSMFMRETLGNFTHPHRVSFLTQHASEVKWVPGTTILQLLERSDSNIAHFSGRIMLLFHILENVQAYISQPFRVDNVVIVASQYPMRRFKNPRGLGYWHKTVLHALLAPAKVKFGTIAGLLGSKKRDASSPPLVRIVKDLQLDKGWRESGKRYVCFRKAILPGFTKGRFFVDDVEYPSWKPSFHGAHAHAPALPRDSLRMRERVHALLKKSGKIEGMRRELVLLHRNEAKRSFDAAGQGRIVGMLRDVCAKWRFNVSIVEFTQLQFEQQYDAVRRAGVAVGIHGANLVNTMFMAPLAAMVEIFPYKFEHEMYENGANAGLKYFRYEMSTGTDYKGLQKYNTTEQCTRLDVDCKRYYRDTTLVVTKHDVQAMRKVVEQAIAWSDSVISYYEQKA